MLEIGIVIHLDDALFDGDSNETYICIQYVGIRCSVTMTIRRNVCTLP